MKAHNHYPALTALFSALTVLAQMASQAGQFQPASSMNVGRVSHTATLLQNGKVLVTGGRSGYGPPPPGGVDQTPIIEGSAELYDPTTDTWTPTGSMITAREMHAALLLTNGEVLVVGGQNFVIMTVGDYEYPAVQHLYSAEIYDPVTEAWRPAADAPGSGIFGKSTLLADGRVFIAESGGLGLIYDPIGDFWTTTSPRPDAPVSGSVALTNGLVLSGGSIYDPATDVWTPVNGGGINALDTPILMTNGTVLVEGYGGGYPFRDSYVSSEIYDPASNVWNAGPFLNVERADHTVTALANGKALVTGGIANAGPLRSAEMLDPVSLTWQMTGSMTKGRQFHTATKLANGKVLITGGAAFLAEAEIYDDSLPTPTPGPVFLTHIGLNPSNFFQFEFTNTPGVSFSVYSISDFRIDYWLYHGEPVEASPGRYVFTDQEASTRPQNSYFVTSP